MRLDISALIEESVAVLDALSAVMANTTLGDIPSTTLDTCKVATVFPPARVTSVGLTLITVQFLLQHLANWQILIL